MGPGQSRFPLLSVPVDVISRGDNRNLVKPTSGIEHQPDVFLARR